MSVLTRTLAEQHEFNARRWAELAADPEIAALPNKIETDRDGEIIMFPPATFGHGDRQSEIVSWLKRLLPKGRVITECGVSTAEGAKVPDVAWFSIGHPQVLEDKINLANPAPEICIEVLSPENTSAEIEQKTALYFESGAREVWICSGEGEMSFLGPTGDLENSRLFPEFPGVIYTFGEQLKEDRERELSKGIRVSGSPTGECFRELRERAGEEKGGEEPPAQG